MSEKTATKQQNNNDELVKQQQQQQQMQQQPQQQVQQKSNNSKMPSLRLDLNLEAEIQLRAKVHGDVTLTLLTS